MPFKLEGAQDAAPAVPFKLPGAKDADSADKPESALADVAKTAASLPERVAAGGVMALPNILNQAVAGPQELYRGLTGREHDDSPLWEPFYSSEDFLQSMPGALRPHTPTTAAGQATDLVGNLVTQVALGKEGLNPKVGPAAIKSLAEPRIAKDESSGGLSPVKKQIASEDRANAFIAKTMLKAGHSPQEIIDTMTRANKFGLTAGEAAKKSSKMYAWFGEQDFRHE